jgi:hypothetical protein
MGKSPVVKNIGKVDIAHSMHMLRNLAKACVHGLVSIRGYQSTLGVPHLDQGIMQVKSSLVVLKAAGLGL